ncbi:MAG: hypothetical protein AAGA46_00080 [Cyanobacteria bacterium P01_F01_bin.13]
MNLNQLHTHQPAGALLSSVQWFWQQVQPLITQLGSLSKQLVLSQEPHVVIDCDLNNQIIFHVCDPYNGKRHTFTSEEATRIWLEKGRLGIL